MFSFPYAARSSCCRTGGSFQEVLSEPLQNAAGLIDQDFLGRIEATLDRHFDALAVAPMNDEGERCARRGCALDVVGFGAVERQCLPVGTRLELEWQHAHAHQVGTVN